MIALMPSEELPPLAPFPDFTIVPQAPGEATVAASSSLLSEAQRQEFARVAGSLEGITVPAPASDPEPSPADDFLLPPAAARQVPEGIVEASFAGKRELPAEEPVLNVDFLAVPGTGKPSPAVSNEAFNLQSIAAALTDAPAPVSVPAAAPPGLLDDWDLPSLFSAPDSTPDYKSLIQPIAAPTPGGKRESVPSALQPSASFAPEKPAHPVFPPGPVHGPSPSPSHPQFPPPRPVGPEPDFDEPLAFPVPSASGHFSVAPPETAVDHGDRGTGMVISGALLIVLGIFLACRVPALALQADAAAVSSQALADVRASHLQGEMFLWAMCGAACLILGIGSATLRRWAPPLIHAASWVVLLTVLTGMGLTTASMFYLSANKTPGDAVPVDGTALFAAAGILGIALPLGLIALFQRHSIARLCTEADRRPRWTDVRSVPSLMVFVTGLMMAVAAFTLGIAGTAAPLFGEIRDDLVATQAWTGLGLGMCIAAGFAAAGNRAGWWLLLVLAAGSATALFLTCQRYDWHLLVHLPAATPPSTVTGIIAASTLLPALLILLMTRKAFSRVERH